MGRPRFQQTNERPLIANPQSGSKKALCIVHLWVPFVSVHAFRTWISGSLQLIGEQVLPANFIVCGFSENKARRLFFEVLVVHSLEPACLYITQGGSKFSRASKDSRAIARMSDARVSNPS